MDFPFKRLQSSCDLSWPLLANLQGNGFVGLCHECGMQGDGLYPVFEMIQHAVKGLCFPMQIVMLPQARALMQLTGSDRPKERRKTIERAGNAMHEVQGMEEQHEKCDDQPGPNPTIQLEKLRRNVRALFPGNR